MSVAKCSQEKKKCESVRRRSIGRVGNTRVVGRIAVKEKGEGMKDFHSVKNDGAGKDKTAVVAMMAALVISTCNVVAPDMAEAARSGGRMGGRSFRSAPRAAPRARASRGGGGISSGGVYVAPPIYGYGGYGGYGLLGPPPIFSPFAFAAPGIFSFFFNIMLLTFAVSFLSGIAKSFMGTNDVDDDFEDEDKW